MLAGRSFFSVLAGVDGILIASSMAIDDVVRRRREVSPGNDAEGRFGCPG
jgi:hypothetical protein